MAGRKVPIKLPPGIVLGETEYEAQGRYVTCDHVRFVQGMPEKIGGWSQWNDDGDEVTEACRSLRCWQDYSFNIWHAFGTASRLWVFDQLKVKTNITPYQSTGTLANPFSTTNGSPIVTVAHVAHGVVADQYVNFSGAAAVGGITISGEYQVRNVIDANSYRITHSANATSTAGPGGGAAVAYSYELAAGLVSVSRDGGWGIGTWGTGTWGTSRSTTAYTQLPRYWSLDGYGQYLLAMPSDGTVYMWALNISTRPTALANAPATGTFMFVTSERVVVVLGADGDPMAMAWSDDDDPEDWTPTPTNLANTRRLQSGNRMIAGASLSQQVNLVWTDTAVYIMQWTGSNEVYATRVLATNCGLVGPAAFTVVDGVAYWMTSNSMHMFSGGGVSKIPNSPDIEYALQSIDAQQRFKVHSHYNAEFREVWWLFPSDGAEEPDTYLAVNIDDWSWITGTMERTAFGSRDLTGKTTLFGVTVGGVIFQHESGKNADGDALDWQLETGYFDVDSGNMGLNIDGYIPDFQRQEGAISLRFRSRDLPEDNDALITDTVSIATTDVIADVRHFGRQSKFQLSQTGVTGGDFRLGAQRIEVGQTATKRQK
jgi:hypothetical protein